MVFGSRWLLALLIASQASDVSMAQDFFSGTLVSVGSEDRPVIVKQVTAINDWTVTDGSVDISQVVRLGNPAPFAEGAVVLFRDQSTLALKDLRSIEGTTLYSSGRPWGRLELPIRPIQGLLLEVDLNPDDTQRRLDKMGRFDGEFDQLRLTNGDVIEGTFRSLNSDVVEFQRQATLLQIERTQVKEIRFARTIGSSYSESNGCWVGLKDGSLLLADEVSVIEEQLTLRLACGVRLQTPRLIQNAFDSLCYLRPHNPNVLELSKLDSLGYKSFAYLGPNWEIQKNRTVTGGILNSADHFSQSGLGMHATSRIAFRIPNGAARFRAKVGVDNNAKHLGSVVFRVFTTIDGSSWKGVVRTPILREGDGPMEIDLPIDGEKGIALAVEHADGADVLDRANWMDARFEMK